MCIVWISLKTPCSKVLVTFADISSEYSIKIAHSIKVHCTIKKNVCMAKFKIEHESELGLTRTESASFYFTGI